MVNLQFSKLSQSQLNSLMNVIEKEKLSALVSTNLVSTSIDTLKSELEKDTDYLWSWQSNLAMAFYDVLPESIPNKHRVCNEGARNFIDRLFNIDISKHQEYKRFISIWEENNLFEKENWPVSYGEGLREDLNLKWKNFLKTVKHVKKVEQGNIPTWLKEEIPPFNTVDKKIYPAETKLSNFIDPNNLYKSLIKFMKDIQNQFSSIDAYTYRPVTFTFKGAEEYVTTYISVVKVI